MANLGPAPKFQFIGSDGAPLFLGKVYTYASGTDTPLDTYTDASAGTPNANPVILDEYGTANIWLGAAAYKFVVKTSADVTVYTVNNVAAAVTSGNIGLFADGTESAPGIAYANDTNTGFYRTASPLGINVSINGTQHSQFRPNQLLIPQLGDSSTPNLAFLNDNDTGIYNPNANQIAIAVGGLSGGQAVQFDELGATFTLGQILAQQPTTASTPQYSFGLSPFTGMYRSAADEISFTNNTTKHFTMTSDGRFYGTALHNNGGAVTGTTNQYIASGTYTPTLTNSTNVVSSSSTTCRWIRVGNVVSVSGQFNITATAPDTDTTMFMTLPIASNFSSTSQTSGSGAPGTGVSVTEAWSVNADTSGDQARFGSYIRLATVHSVAFIFQYEVL